MEYIQTKDVLMLIADEESLSEKERLYLIKQVLGLEEKTLEVVIPPMSPGLPVINTDFFKKGADKDGIY